MLADGASEAAGNTRANRQAPVELAADVQLLPQHDAAPCKGVDGGPPGIMGAPLLLVQPSTIVCRCTLLQAQQGYEG